MVNLKIQLLSGAVGAARRLRPILVALGEIPPGRKPLLIQSRIIQEDGVTVVYSHDGVSDRALIPNSILESDIPVIEAGLHADREQRKKLQQELARIEARATSIRAQLYDPVPEEDEDEKI